MIARTIFNALKPFKLISLMMTYLMGAGLVKYFRGFSGWSVLIQGGFFLLFFVVSLELLCLLHSLQEPKRWLKAMGLEEVRLTRVVIATLSATLLTVATSILISWMKVTILWHGLVFLLFVLFAVGTLYYLAQTNKYLKPYALLIEVVLFVVIPPLLAYFLYSDDLHPFLTLVVISLTPAYLANRLLHLLESFGHDQKYEVDTIVIRMGWEKALFFHNALILLTYFLMALISVLGAYWLIIWPVFLTLPLGLLEIWLMERLRRGLKPLWWAMRVASACVFLLPIYFIGFSLWVH
ncbi:MAG: hypothetical protein GX142_01955 [Chloroflexi bacterium]|nr:hypothetical protein [Chloroflexota bacterium]